LRVFDRNGTDVIGAADHGQRRIGRTGRCRADHGGGFPRTLVIVVDPVAGLGGDQVAAGVVPVDGHGAAGRRAIRRQIKAQLHGRDDGLPFRDRHTVLVDHGGGTVAAETGLPAAIGIAGLVNGPAVGIPTGIALGEVGVLRLIGELAGGQADHCAGVAGAQHRDVGRRRVAPPHLREGYARVAKVVVARAYAQRRSSRTRW